VMNDRRDSGGKEGGGRYSMGTTGTGTGTGADLSTSQLFLSNESLSTILYLT
jgi:hypothetical protein